MPNRLMNLRLKGTGRFHVMALALGLLVPGGEAALDAAVRALSKGQAGLAPLLLGEAQAAPYSDSEIRAVETPDEAKIRELRDQEIHQLRITLGRRQPANRMADLYYRLAESYLEAYRATYLLEGRVHDKHIEAGRQESGIDHSRSRPYLQGGIQSCKAILGYGIRFDKLDRVYYFLGFNHGELGNKKESLKYFAELVQRFPQSALAAEAYKELGDGAFGDLNYRAAARNYEIAIQKASADSAPRLYHKLAWSYYRLKQYDRAVETMKQAVASAQRSGEKFLNLREEALRDMAIFMTETGRVEEAISYFQGVAGDKNFYPRLLERLGKQYERNVEPAKATQVYESLLKTNPESEGAFRVLVKLVDLDLRRRRYSEALARVQNVHLPKGGESDTVTAAQNLRAMIRRTATEHHELWRKKSDKAALGIAEQYYSVYLRVFLAQDDSRQETPEIEMYLAEVERDLGKSREASELYRKVVDSRDHRYAKEAGALWTASLAEAIKKSSGTQSHGTDPSPLELEFVAAADRLQDALGDTPEGREAALKAAEVLAGYHSTQKDALRRAKKIVSRNAKSPQAVTAARLWLQIYADRIPTGAGTGNVAVDPSAADDLRDAIQELRSNAALLEADQELGKGKLKAAISDQETRLKVISIARSEQDKDFTSAARGYETFAKEAGSRDLAEKAYANALSSYSKAGDSESVERVSSAWVRRFPKSPRAVESLRGSATAFLIAGKTDLAVRLFERLGTEGGDAASLETAARLQSASGDASGDSARAQELWGRYLATYKDAAGRGQALLILAKLKEAAGKDSEAAQLYQECLSRGELNAPECGARLADLHARSKNIAEAKALFKRVASQSKAPSRPAAGRGKAASASVASSSPWVGYAQFRLAQFMEEEARFAPLQFPEAQLKAALNQRLEFLEPLSRAYTAAVEAGGPWAIAALSRLASWATRFADEIDRIEPPAGAAPEAVARFRQNLSNISLPLRKKAAQTAYEAYSKAGAWEVLSPALPEMVDRLASAHMKGLGRAQGVRGRMRLAGIPADGGSEGRGNALERLRERLTKNPQDAAAWVDYGNLLWGDRKPALARVAYDRALAVSPHYPAALNNRAVVALSGEKGPDKGEEDWLASSEALAALGAAVRQDPFFVTAKFNRALLLNYYRVFEKAKPLWDQVLAKNSTGAIAMEAHDGLGVALQGVGRGAEADAEFKAATDLGASRSRFAALFHQAARLAEQGQAGAAQCLTTLDSLDESSLEGFEKDSAARLRKECTQWK